MIRGYTAQQVRDAEKPHLAAGEPLMQRAAQSLAERILQLLESRPAEVPARVLLLVGAGDNGGDALFAGAQLARTGVFAGADRPRADTVVEVLGVGSRMHEAGAAEAADAGARLLDAGAATTEALDEAATRYAVIVDGIIGTGTSAGSPALRGPARDVVVTLRARLAERGETEPGPVVVAVDMPSGVDPDTGAVADDAVLPADVTVTFGGIKAGLLLGEGARLAGRIDLVEIGIEADLAAMTPVIDLP